MTSGEVPSADRGNEVAQLTPAAIEQLKARLRESPLLLSRVAAEAGVQLSVRQEDFDGSPYATPDEEWVQTQDIAFEAAESTASWVLAIKRTVDLPGSTWDLAWAPGELANLIDAAQERANRIGEGSVQ